MDVDRDFWDKIIPMEDMDGAGSNYLCGRKLSRVSSLTLFFFSPPSYPDEDNI